MTVSRRRFMSTVAAAVAGSTFVGWKPQAARASRESRKLHLATNSYPWTTFYRREQRDFNASLDAGLAEVARSGVDGFEPGINSPADVDRLAPLLKKHGLEMRSLYVNSVLHDADKADASIGNIVSVAGQAAKIGTKIIVTNPSPIRWGGEESKSDAQLKVQAAALNRLGRRLKESGLTLAYHNHDMELRLAAREFHHMMLGTDPQLVTFCLDAHWIFRGSGNSTVALFDIIKLYGSRVSELHVRQSIDHVWTETLCEGDIDYPAVVRALRELGVRPHVVLEQAVEEGTPKTMDAVEAHRRDCEYARRVFAPFVFAQDE